MNHSFMVIVREMPTILTAKRNVSKHVAQVQKLTLCSVCGWFCAQYETFNKFSVGNFQTHTNFFLISNSFKIVLVFSLFSGVCSISLVSGLCMAYLDMVTMWRQVDVKSLFMEDVGEMPTNSIRWPIVKKCVHQQVGDKFIGVKAEFHCLYQPHSSQ